MTMNHDKDRSHLHDPYQLPTPRSSIESRVSDDKPFSITLNTIPARKSGCLIKPEHTLQTPRSRTPSLDIPAPLVEASLLGTRGGNSAVDNVRDFLQGQHTVTIQVCRGLFNKAYIYVLVQEFQGIGSKEFDELYDILSDSRVRYFYNLGCSISAHLTIILDLILTPISRLLLSECQDLLTKRASRISTFA
jgi:hypothetical protein